MFETFLFFFLTERFRFFLFVLVLLGFDHALGSLIQGRSFVEAVLLDKGRCRLANVLDNALLNLNQCKDSFLQLFEAGALRSLLQTVM